MHDMDKKYVIETDKSTCKHIYLMLTSRPSKRGGRTMTEVKVEIKATITNEQGKVVFDSESSADNIGQALLEANNSILESCLLSGWGELELP